MCHSGWGMLTAREVLPLSGASWEYAAFMIVYFVAIRYAKVLDEEEMGMVKGIKNNHIEYQYTTLASTQNSRILKL